MKIKKLTLALAIAALGSGTLAAFASTQYIQNTIASQTEDLYSRYKKRPFVVAVRPLPAGTTIGKHDLTVVQLIPQGLQADVVQPGQMQDLVGKTVKYDLSPGAAITASQISFSEYEGLMSLVDEGEKLITIAVNALNSISGMLSPGDLVDVLYTDRSTNTSITVTLLNQMKVIATGQRIENQIGINNRDFGYNTVTLSCEPEACQQLTHAQARGDLSLVLTGKSTGDSDLSEREYPHETSDSDLLGIKMKPAKKKVKRKKTPKVRVYDSGQLIQ